MDREDVINRPFDENDIEGFIDGATAHLDITPVQTARDIIAAEAMTGFPNGERAQTIAKNVLAALEKAGYVVMAPQDIEWGECPERTVEWDDNGGHEVSPPGPHSVSLNMCAFCLQYDPD